MLLTTLPRVGVWLWQRVHEPQSLVQVRRRQQRPAWQDELPEVQAGGGGGAPSPLTGNAPLMPARAPAARELLYFLCSVNKAIRFINTYRGDLLQGEQPRFYPLPFPTACRGFLFVALHVMTPDTCHCLGTLGSVFLPLQVLSLGFMEFVLEDVASASFSPNY